MRNVSDSKRSISDSEASGEIRNFTDSFEGKDRFKNLIFKANKISFINIFNFYKLNLSNYNKKITCPFLSHKGGKERTASFYFYPETNTFYCHGCKKGTYPVDFVSEMDHLNKNDAALKIFSLFKDYIPNTDHIENEYSSSEKINILMEFSSTIRDFHQNHLSAKAFAYIERVSEIFDHFNSKEDLSLDALDKIISCLKDKISSYTENSNIDF